MTKIDDIIVASDGCILFYIPENKVWGSKARLAVYKGKQLTEEDFRDLPKSEATLIDGQYYTFFGWSYSDIKTFIIKLHYSNDDQIALMLNYQSNPTEYEDRYNGMQIWRNFASEIAKKYTEQ